MKNFSYNGLAMKKDAPLAFRIPAELKRGLEEIAKREARSMSQVCEMLLTLGVEAYEKAGPTYLQRFLAQRRPRATGR
jgi:hypothetical protein